MEVIVGIDIGGTKCAVSFAEVDEETVRIMHKEVMPTETQNFEKAMQEFIICIEKKLRKEPEWRLQAIGVSCGGPLDSKKGLILAPPNLPKWDHVDCLTPLAERFSVPVALQNDADACALAEWRWGAGKGTQNMIFLTFGTGMGAGLILDGRLYVGSNNLAGEIGHVRLAKDGPMGYGKQGSFEGYCSGGGIANLGRIEAKKALEKGVSPMFCQTIEDLPRITARKIADAMDKGDSLAKEIYETVGRYLGKGLSILIDVLNPEVIVIGSIFVRQQKVLEPVMREEIEKESLFASARSCRIVPAQLGEMVGDYASVSVGVGALYERNVSKQIEFSSMPLK